EQLVHPVFMPRNEEEVMRNMMALSSQLRYVNDVPQVIISFVEQTDTEIAFSIVYLRILRLENMKSVQETLAPSSIFLECTADNPKVIGIIRRKYPKEATVLQVKIAVKDFLRGDHAVDMYRARQAIVDELVHYCGDFRDYNGGMITKEKETFNLFFDALGELGRHHELLVENFFFSMTPVVMRTILEPEAMANCFKILLAGLQDGFFDKGLYSLKTKLDDSFAYAVIRAENSTFAKTVMRQVQSLGIPDVHLACVKMCIHDSLFLAFIYRCDDLEEQVKFSAFLEQALEEWSQQAVVNV
ncbi:hypothetical protein JYU14_04755, partial [Simkania negevensis]|nr:hypothetical protein [Simkania negevensis]